MNFSELNKDNYIFFAIKHYSNPQAVTKEDFFEDLKRFKYLKKLLKHYKTTGVLKVHLILNHLIVLYNVFNDAATPLLFFKIESEYWTIIKSFIIYLNRYPEISNDLDNISVDQYCIKELQKL